MTRAFPRWALLTTAAMLVPAMAAEAHLVPAGDLWASIPSDHAMVADPLWGLEPGSRGELAALLPDDPTGAASVGKSWTLHMAVHALREGIVPSKMDVVTVSPDAASRLCNCFQDINGVDIAAREQARFWDLVTAMHSVSSNDIAQAVAEHIGQQLDASCSLGPYPSGCLQEYLAWANAHVHSAEVGASMATDFDFSWSLDETTARDVLRWWVHALEDPDPNFLEVAGYVGTYAFTTLPPFSKNYTFTRGAGSYPGWEASKPGLNAICNGDMPSTANACMVAAATRIGRRLVEVQMQGNPIPDRAALFDYGFAKVFHPAAAGLSEPWAPVAQHALACVSGSKAVSAVVKPSGVPRLVLWDVDLEAPSITTATEANPALLPDHLDLKALAPEPTHSLLNLPIAQPGVPLGAVNAALAAAPDPQLPPLPRLPVRPPVPLPPVPPVAIPDTPLGPILEVDIQPLGTSAVVVAHRGPAAVQLGTWGIAGQDLVPLGSTVFPAPGMQGLQLQALTANRFLLALHEQDGDRRFQSWRAHGDGSMELVEAFTTTAVEEFDLAVQTHLGAPLLFVGARDIFDGLRTEVWRMDPDGTLEFGAGFNDGSLATRIAASAAPVEALPGEFVEEPYFSLAYRDAGGFGRIRSWAFDGLDLVERGNDVVSAAPLPESVQFDLAPLGSSGLMMAKRLPGIGIDLDVFETRRAADATVQALFIVGHEVAPVDDLRGFCKVPHPGAQPSEGDYLLAYDEFFEDGLQLSGWRSGERPHA